jgi:hypothetical protein
MDKYGKNGGLVFSAFFMGETGDPVIAHKNLVVQEEAYTYGHHYYR